jgi:soluble lytic murein transglycosylase-like protein
MKETENAILAFLAVIILLITMCCGAYKEYSPSTEEAVIEKTVTLEKVTEQPAEVEETVEEKPDTYDVPLDEEVQLVVIEEAKAHGIDPEIIFAMIEKESNYKADAIGDNGNSFGLLQIQAKWHYERMANLGCTDLLDAEQNIKVGVDILAELVEKYDGNIEMALVAYNCGSSGAYRNFFQYGEYSSSYSVAVLERANEIKGGETNA